jgi:hypothetical protein
MDFTEIRLPFCVDGRTCGVMRQDHASNPTCTKLMNFLPMIGAQSVLSEGFRSYGLSAPYPVSLLTEQPFCVDVTERL